MTPEEVKRRFPHASEAFIKANVTRLSEAVPQPPQWKFEFKQSGDESRLNGTEIAYLSWLRAQGDDWIGIQCITLRLAWDTRYTPDFWAFDIHGLRAIDTKHYRKKTGKPHIEDDALVKIKIAARMFPWIRFVIAWRENLVWQHREIKV